MSEEKIISKIKKLLSLSTSSNKAEAELSYKRAMELMVRHNIESMPKEKTYGEDYYRMRKESPEIKAINMILINCFFVKAYTKMKLDTDDYKFYRTYTYYGEKVNLELALYAIDYLTKEFKRQWKVESKKNGWDRRHKESFYYGLMVGFISSYKERKNYVENEMALVLVDDPNLEAYCKEENPNSKSKTTNMNTSAKDAVEQGIENGKDIKIAKAVEEKSDSKILLLG